MIHNLALGGYEPKKIKTTGQLLELSAGCNMIYPNVGCAITGLYKTGDDVTNYADIGNYATDVFSADDQIPIVCGAGTWGKIEISAGTCWDCRL